MLLRENFLQNRMVDTDAIYGRNTGRTFTILAFLMYVHNMFHLHPLKRGAYNGLIHRIAENGNSIDHENNQKGWLTLRKVSL